MTRRMCLFWMRFLAAGGLGLAVLAGAAADSWAQSLDGAKAAGLVGERPDGYVAAVQPDPAPDIAALVQQINVKRRAAYEEIATREKVPVQQVGALAAEKIKAQAPSGHLFMTTEGTWAEK